MYDIIMVYIYHIIRIVKIWKKPSWWLWLNDFCSFLLYLFCSSFSLYQIWEIWPIICVCVMCVVYGVRRILSNEWNNNHVIRTIHGGIMVAYSERIYQKSTIFKWKGYTGAAAHTYLEYSIAIRHNGQCFDGFLLYTPLTLLYVRFFFWRNDKMLTPKTGLKSFPEIRFSV